MFWVNVSSGKFLSCFYLFDPLITHLDCCEMIVCVFTTINIVGVATVYFSEQEHDFVVPLLLYGLFMYFFDIKLSYGDCDQKFRSIVWNKSVWKNCTVSGDVNWWLKYRCSLTKCPDACTTTERSPNGKLQSSRNLADWESRSWLHGCE